MDKSLEDKWRKAWESRRVYESDYDPSKPALAKLLVTFPFPYMNGPLHIGHGFSAVRLDVYARFKRMQGYRVLFPWAWHWTGQPIVAAAERLSRGDQAIVREFVELDHVPQSEIKKFYDPEYMARYYTDSGRVALKELGLSIDWRREFHTTELEPTFNRFVIWQYNKLHERGFVTRGTHPVVWCPRDQSPTGDHDRLIGEGVMWEELTLVLFPLSEEAREKEQQIMLPAATFRPETIFGVTNLWVNPESWYVEVLVNSQSRQIMSEIAAEKMRNQLKQIEIVRQIRGRDIIGRHVRSPVDSASRLVVLPAAFVAPDNGTGVVYSVPAHAPADYVALRDLQNDDRRIAEFGLDRNEVCGIKAVGLINVPGFGEFPAVEIVEKKYHILNQSDPSLEDATAELYKKEFHQGVLNEKCGDYESKRVSEVKPLIVAELTSKGLADSMYELPEKVVCRCTTQCIVKVLQDQWFLKYSDPEWKKLAHQCVDQAKIYPEFARRWFHDVIDWLKDWPCARRVGLGTPLPWSKGWIVETLSDSTIYNAFYTVRPSLVKLGLNADALTDELFDYVFLGEGDAGAISSTIGIAKPQIENMRSEFLYWYPVDVRNSGKELVPNHLTFFVFQHVAMFPKELWPQGISANGMVTIEGVKMSKSKGNVITLSGALEQYGADGLRAALVMGAEGLDDLDWREKMSRDVQFKVLGLLDFAVSLYVRTDNVRGQVEYSQPDLWFETRIQRHIEKAISSLEILRTKTAFQESFYSYWNTVKYYLSRNPSPPADLMKYAMETWVSILAPFLPYSCEEMNSRFGKQDLIVSSPFPKPDPGRIHPQAELQEILIGRLKDDAQKILKILRGKPTKLYVYTAPVWKYELFGAVLESKAQGQKTNATLQRFFDRRPDLPKKEVADTIGRISKVLNEFGEDFAKLLEASGTRTSESRTYKEASEYLADQLGLSVLVLEGRPTAADDPKGRATLSLPFKPALYVE